MAAPLTNPHGINTGLVSLTGEIAGDNQIKIVSDGNNNDIIASNSNFLSDALGNITMATRSLRNTASSGLPADVRALADQLGPVADKLVGISRTVEGDHNETATTVRDGVDNVVDYRSNSSLYVDSGVNRVGNLYTGLDNAEGGFGFAAFSVPSTADESGILNLFNASFTESDGTRTTFVALRRNASGVLEWNNRTKDIPATNVHNVQHNANFSVATSNTATITASNTSFNLDFPTITDEIREDSIAVFHHRVAVTRPSGVVAFYDGITINRPEKPASNSAVRYDDVVDWTDEGPIAIDGRFFYIQYRIKGAANARQMEWRLDTSRTPASQLSGYSLDFERNYIAYYVTVGGATSGADDWAAVRTSGGAWTGSTAEYRVGIQFHPANPADPTSHSEGVPVVYIPSTGANVQFNDLEYTALDPIEFTTMSFGDDAVPYKFFTNDFGHNLTHSNIVNLLTNHWSDMWALGYVSVRTTGTDTRISGDLEVSGNVDITGSYMVNGSAFSAGGSSFPSDFETETGSTVAMDASHIGKVVVMSNSSAKTYNINNSLGSDGDIIMFQNSGAGVLTIVNPLTTVDDIVVASDSSVVIRKFTQSGFSYWYHTAIARPTDATSTGGGGLTWPSSTVSTLAGTDEFIVQDDSTTNDEERALTYTNLLTNLQRDLDFLPHSNTGFFDQKTPQNTTRNTYTVQASDHGKILAINPEDTTGTEPNIMYVYFPTSLPLYFTCDIVFDGYLQDDALVRIGTRHMIGRPESNTNNASSWVKQDHPTTGFRTVSAANVRSNTNFDFFDLWYANDSIRVTKANTANWYKIDILRYNAFEPPANPTTSGAQSLGRATSTFTSTTTTPINYNVGTITKFRQIWQAN